MSNTLLTLVMAKKIAEATEKEALNQQLKLVISIYDNHGNLKYFQRMDDTAYGSIRISQLKAKTSASMPISSKKLAEKSANLVGNPYSALPDTLLLGGGLPIITPQGQFIGAIGVSGATPELDELCAQAGLTAMTSI